MKTYFCFHCKTRMPYLEEEEWARVSPLLNVSVQAIKDYREAHGCDLKTAKMNCIPEVTREFESITGVANVDYGVIAHHRLQDWGQECGKCDALLRTPKAVHCANCGWRPGVGC